MKERYTGAPGLRALWRAALILAAFYLLPLGIALALGALMNAFFGVWGVTQDNILRAPVWIRLISGHWAEWVTIAQNLALLPLAFSLSRLWGARRLAKGGLALKGFLLGVASALALAGTLLLIDGLRMGRPMTRPQFTWELLIPLAMYFCAALGTEVLLRGALTQALAPWPLWARSFLGAAAFALLTAPAWNGLALVNLFLLGLLLQFTAEKTGGYLAGALARFGLYTVLYVVLGCAGSASVALYECYPAGHDLLSGAAQGPLGGLLATLAMAVALAWIGVLYIREKDGGKKTNE